MYRSVWLKPLYFLFLQEPSTQALQLQAASAAAANTGIPGMKITPAFAAQQARLALQLEARNKKTGEEKKDSDNGDE